MRHSDYLKHKGIMLVVSSPSGAGKTTITRELLNRDRYLTLSTSMTTRAPRPGEVHGVHYYFADVSTFHSRIEEGSFLEYAKVFGNYYGTPREPVKRRLDEGMDILFDIDWQGAQKMVQEMPGNVVSVFILPPDIETLEKRLHMRNQDSDEVITQRMDKAIEEMSHWAEYDYVVVNDDLEKAIQDILSILRSERLKRVRQVALSDFVRSMIGEEE